MRPFRSILLLAALVMAGSCVEEDPVVPSVDGTPIEFSASKMRVITKAGDSAEPFDDGTKFKLFAVEDSDGAHNWSNTVLYDRSGVLVSGLVSYGDKVSYGVDPLNVLDFYGVTYGGESEIYVSDSEGNELQAGDVPMVPVDPGAGVPLPDLMYSNNLKSKTSASGRLEMEFRHTMAKLNIEILKQDESADPEGDRKLESAVLEKIVLKGTGVSGTFNVETGLWESVSTEDAVVFNASHEITTDAKTVVSGHLAIPVTDGKVSLDVYLSGIDGAKDNPITYTLTIGKDEGGNDLYLNLEQSHEYTLSVAVLKNDVRIVTVTPKVYEWIDVELDTGDAYFGQPVYFGGLMWMDRNLGAKSADCKNDWYNTIGHYYQFGRNIPFILDVEKWLAYTEDDGKKDLKEARIIKENQDRITRLHPQWDTYDEVKKSEVLKNMVECVYSLNHKGQRVHGYYNIAEGDHLIRKPGDVILNSDGDVDDELTSKSYRYGGNVQTWTLSDNRAAYYWNDVEDQPCPKGWRVPTMEDLYSFMPRGQQVNWNSSRYPVSLSSSSSKYNTGKYGYVEGVDGRYNVCYMIKNPGTDNAYRILIKSHFAKNTNGEGYSKNKRYISITRFSATKEDKIEDYTSSTYDDAILPGSKENTLWNNPIESSDFPGCGYFVPDGHNPDLRSFGWGTIMRTSDPTGFDTGSVNNSSNWVQYLSVTDYQLSIQSGSRRVLGDQLRCVRDVNAK